MFTLCMSRGPPQRDANNCNIENKQIKGGYLLRYRKGFFCNGWTEEWIVLYEDSTLAWFADKGLSRAKGYVRIGDTPDLLAVGEYTAQVPRRPRIPEACRVAQLLAIGTGRAQGDPVHWLLAQSTSELNDWMTAISNTLPPPDQIPIKRLSLTSHSNGCTLNGYLRNGHNLNQHNCRRLPVNAATTTAATTTTVTASGDAKNINAKRKPVAGPEADADHTAISGLAIDWGHGWGWGQTAWAAQSACLHDHGAAVAAVVPNAGLFCNGGEDYGVGGYEEVDWSAFGDFSF